LQAFVRLDRGASETAHPGLAEHLALESWVDSIQNDERRHHAAGSRHEAQLKQRDPMMVRKVETDLSRIQQLSQEHDEENWKFGPGSSSMLQMTSIA
jgi:hypothetical protein